jgi:hypothetical protein
MGWPIVEPSHAQRCPVGMVCPAELVVVDLPVDVIVVLEQQERAGQPERTERALRERGGSC